MNNYKQTNITGYSYTRSPRAILDNGFGQVPRIMFEEEIRKVFADGTSEVTPAPGPWPQMAYQPGFTFPMINPMDDTPMGVDGSLDQLEVLLYSLYKFMAAQRDAKQAV